MQAHRPAPPREQDMRLATLLRVAPEGGPDDMFAACRHNAAACAHAGRPDLHQASHPRPAPLHQKVLQALR